MTCWGRLLLGCGLAIAMMAGPSVALDADLAFDATVTLQRSNGAGGTGFVCEVPQADERFVQVLTCGHVAGQEDSLAAFFYHDGQRVGPFAAAVRWRVDSAPFRDIWPVELKTVHDLALVEVPAAALGFRPPRLKLAARSAQLREAVYSSGCPSLNWPSLIRGHSYGQSGDVLLFSPEIIPGRSGSAVLNNQGEVVGVVIGYRSGVSIGLSLERLRKDVDACQLQPLGTSRDNLSDKETYPVLRVSGSVKED